jgi:predicted SnoaL-like aldol condensation-catalyzing enzyme
MSYTAEEQANLDLVAGLFREVLNPMDSGAVDRFIDPGYIQHSQLAPPGLDALKSFLDMIKGASPQAVHDVKRMFADKDHVIVHYHVRRWPEDNGFAVMDIFRCETGFIVEHWDVTMDVQTEGPNPNSPF